MYIDHRRVNNYLTHLGLKINFLRKKKKMRGIDKMYSNASNARVYRETGMRPEKRGAADRVTAMHGALNLPLEREGSEKMRH